MKVYNAKPWYKKWWAIPIGGVLALGIIGNLTDGGTEPEPAPTVTVTASPEPAPSVEVSSLPASADAVVLLEQVPVKGRAPKTGYDRALFGQTWADVDRNGCDTRNDILNRDLTNVAHKPGTGDCVVLSGVLADPFTATVINFVRDEGTSNAVQIDHVVSLSDAWQKGAQQLSVETRTLFANDPLNLLAVDGPSNGSKGDGDAATWLPKNKAFRCDYVTLQTAVKAKYGLWMTQPEHDAIASILAGCPGQKIPDGTLRPDVTATAPPTSATSAPVVVEDPEPAPADVYYKNCTAAREAGAAPVRKGDPGYGKHLDRDGDGTACE